MPYNRRLIAEYARVTAEAKRLGHSLHGATQANDRWITATTLTLGVPLLTGNRRHFEDFPRLAVLGEQ